MKKVWLTWEKHRRTWEIASSLSGVELFELEFESRRLIRYPVLLIRTALVMARTRPDLVIVQNPSVVLALFMVSIGKIMTRCVVVDSHNEGLKPFSSKYKLLLPLYRFIQRKANLTIVTNNGLAEEVERNGGRPFVLEDKIPEFKATRHMALRGEKNIVFICTFEKDEPYQEVIRSAAMIDPEICLYVTGRYEKAPPEVLRQAPENVVFTGFLSEQDYKSLLFSSDVVMDLTVMEDCLVCGAYEALAVEKPLILSDTASLRKYFRRGAVYTLNRAEDIASAIQSALQGKEKFQRDVRELKEELRKSWTRKMERLEELFNSSLKYWGS